MKYDKSLFSIRINNNNMIHMTTMITEKPK